jgi:hypothetical protein
MGTCPPVVRGERSFEREARAQIRDTGNAGEVIDQEALERRHIGDHDPE